MSPVCVCGIRTPWLFNAVWKILNPFFDDRTRSKIQFTYMAKKSDVEDGGRIANMLNDLVGPEWREITGCEAPFANGDTTVESSLESRLWGRKGRHDGGSE